MGITSQSITKWAFVALWVLLTGCTTSFSEPENMATFRQRLIDYHDKGAYVADLNKACAPAYKVLKQKAHESPKQAVVFDVDETTLSNWPKLLKVQFSSNLAVTEEWIRRGEADAIEPTFKLYQYARQMGYGVFFVTGRNEDKRQVTEANLRRTGYTDFEKLICFKGDRKLGSAAEYKEQARAEIEGEGWKIILNVGDQASDLTGLHTGINIKLPNPFYFIK